jgi:DNA-binding NarL/FixJ family response regulator
MTIGVVLHDNDKGPGRSLARLLEAEALDVEITGVAGEVDELERLVAETLPEVVLMPTGTTSDGVEHIRRIRAASPTTRIVLLAARDEPDLYRALRAGGSGYVGVADGPATIAAAVRSVCRGQLVIPAHLAGEVLRELEDTSPLPLNSAEREVLAGVARGESTREIGSRLRISERAVHRRVEDIYSKLHLADRVAAMAQGSRRASEDLASRANAPNIEGAISA